MPVSLAALSTPMTLQQCALTVYTAASPEFTQADNRRWSALFSLMDPMTLFTSVNIPHLTSQPDLTVCYKHNKEFVIVSRPPLGQFPHIFTPGQLSG